MMSVFHVNHYFQLAVSSDIHERWGEVGSFGTNAAEENVSDKNNLRLLFTEIPMFVEKSITLPFREGCRLW